jgi:hypothetical protein
MSKFKVKNSWENEPCYVIGLGSSLRGFNFHRLAGLHTIITNDGIEDFPESEWFLFLNVKLIKNLQYNLCQYKGQIFTQINTRQTCNYKRLSCKTPEELNNKLKLSYPNIIFFKVRPNESFPTLKFKDGLFNGYLSGIAATHLAIISGANPIYLLGLDCGGKENEYYCREMATGYQESVKKYENGAQYFEKFKPWADKIINLSAISTIETFRKLDMEEHLRSIGR